jgi:D-alanyl-lipoteichoic acid acyltransferase DltB (MBOAT superfamily)
MSMVFLYQYDHYSPIVILTTSVFSYVFAALIEKGKNKSFYHGTGVIALLLLLAVFKYLGFLDQTIHSLFSFVAMLPKFRIEKLILPLGISYLVFKHISFLTDVYWGLTKRGGFADFLCYTSFFPIYIAGPIERYEKFLPQISSDSIQFDKACIESSIFRVVIGIFKKLVFADWISYFIDPLWANYHSQLWYLKLIALLGYSLQIYIDFSAYSDIAIGSSKVFGFTIMENFNNPYLKPNISAFWQSWHISLSSWIRDYVFFPLSKVSSGKIWSLFFVPVIAMGLCGLWHGAAWHFVIWGIWHGMGISVFQFWSMYKRKHKEAAKMSRTAWFNYISILITFAFVTFGWWWFR